MKKHLMIAVLALGGLASAGAQAQTATGNFDVVINLTSACQLSTITNVTFNYTSGQVAAANSAGGGFSVTCPNTLPYTMALDQTNVTDAALNLAYTLAFSAAGPYVGSGGAQNYTIDGTMAGGQSGTCGAASCTNAASANRTRTLTVSW